MSFTSRILYNCSRVPSGDTNSGPPPAARMEVTKSLCAVAAASSNWKSLRLAQRGPPQSASSCRRGQGHG
eukprot:3257447-Pyramimonas_sp.AAC.1